MNRVRARRTSVPAQLKPQREGKSTSRSQSTVRHVYKSNYEIKDVRAA